MTTKEKPQYSDSKKGEYTELSTGHIVIAIQTGHDGIVMSLMSQGDKARFEEGDWIIKYQPDFQGNQREAVIEEKDFERNYKRVGAPPGIDWKALGWMK